MGFERFAPVERLIDVCGTPYTFWMPPDLEALIDVQAFERDERIPYWANVWESALVLAEEVSALDGGGRRFLELGCGLALPAVVAVRRGFAAVASDYEEDALEGVRFNADRNGAASLEVRLLDWRRLPDDLGTFDIVGAADVLYEKHHAEALAAVIARTITAVVLCVTAGCSDATFTNAFTQLTQQINTKPTTPPKATNRSTRSTANRAPSLPHGATCTCPTIVSGTSYGCWEAL
ncbi:MAG: methyltransferase domain-containing protein [Planctomycetia bacterium]|nr:methyltransferase domain-containing protein [Planctomycetia bacterium]